MENSIESFLNSLFFFISRKLKSKGLLIKKHTENLTLGGDFSFPKSLKSWHEHLTELVIESDFEDDLLKSLSLNFDNILKESTNWSLVIKKLEDHNKRINIFVDRPYAIKTGILEALRNNVYILEQLQNDVSYVQTDILCESNSLTFLRLKYLSDVIDNLYRVSVDSKHESLKTFVTSKSSSPCPENLKKILCGAVLNSKSGVKEDSLTSDEYVRVRQDEMTLIAQHKYGVRVCTDTKWNEFLSHLGESAVVFELLQIKPNSAVKINFECSSEGSSKGAAFVLYNCARLETMIRTYNEKVEEKSYPPLPAVEEVDFSLLTQEDEWYLIFNFIMGLPSLLTSAAEVNRQMAEFKPHLICGFLSSMVRTFSQYYRKTRILTEPRKHMLPIIFARMHMLKVLNGTLKTCLKILNIKSVSQM